LVSRNAATLPAELAAAELFGNLKGYPNPGTPDREGLISAAHDGTLFLDEVADLPERTQAHLLRVLDAGEYQRLGESRVRRARIRLVAATNLPKSRLRHDLLARFEFCIETTPLRQRRADLPLLVRHLLREMTLGSPDLIGACFEANGLPRLAPSFVRGLARDDFDLNARGLRQRLWTALAGAAGGPLRWPTRPVATQTALAHEGSEADRIQRVLDEHNGSLDETWRALGLSSRHALARLIKKHRLRVTRSG
jgi:DNA-binding NtrC family response regulator